MTFSYLPKQNTSCLGQFIIFPDNISIDKQQKHSEKLNIPEFQQLYSFINIQLAKDFGFKIQV